MAEISDVNQPDASTDALRKVEEITESEPVNGEDLLEEKAWDLEQVVEMTAEYIRRKEDSVFEVAFAAI